MVSILKYPFLKNYFLCKKKISGVTNQRELKGGNQGSSQLFGEGGEGTGSSLLYIHACSFNTTISIRGHLGDTFPIRGGD